MIENLNTLRDRAHAMAVQKGWHPSKDPTNPAFLARITPHTKIRNKSTGEVGHVVSWGNAGWRDKFIVSVMWDSIIAQNLALEQLKDYDLSNLAPADPQRLPELLALLHSEVSETLEAYRSHGLVRWTREDGKPEGVGPELADVIIRVLDICGLYGLDIDALVREKMDFNATRPFRHGGKLA